MIRLPGTLSLCAPPPDTPPSPPAPGRGMRSDVPGGRARPACQYFHSALQLKGRPGTLLKASTVIAGGIKLNEAHQLPEVVHLQPPKSTFRKKSQSSCGVGGCRGRLGSWCLEFLRGLQHGLGSLGVQSQWTKSMPKMVKRGC